MSTLSPTTKPRLSESDVRQQLSAALQRLSEGVKLQALWTACPVVLFARRGYYRDTMGKPGINDAGIYDDAAWLVTPDAVLPWNWNTDPSVIGWNRALGKPYAMLKEGIWPFVKGLHKGKVKAWRQPYAEQAKAAKLGEVFTDWRKLGHFTVLRDANRPGVPVYEDTGYHAINIHNGSELGTSSWGCQTAPPRQYPDFQKRSYALTEGQRWLPYVLSDH